MTDYLLSATSGKIGMITKGVLILGLLSACAGGDGGFVDAGS